MPRKVSFPSAPNNNGSYRVGIGKREFNLGVNREIANKRFNRLVEFWEYQVPSKLWTPELIAEAQSLIAHIVPERVAAPVPTPTPQPQPAPVHTSNRPLIEPATIAPGLMFHASLDQWLKFNEARI